MHLQSVNLAFNGYPYSLGGTQRFVPGVSSPKTSTYPRTEGPVAPAWLAFDRQVSGDLEQLLFQLYYSASLDS